jgi:tetrahedral aminopeptidase
MKFLKKLIETPGVPGREERVRDLIKSEIKGLFDEVRVDPMGNMICRKRPGRKASKPAIKVLIACHIDEIGFYVRHIDDNGFLRVQNVGGFDTRNLFARRVLVQGKKDLVGVLNPRRPSDSHRHGRGEEEDLHGRRVFRGPFPAQGPG